MALTRKLQEEDLVALQKKDGKGKHLPAIGT